jgi:voltage-gated potassium channel
MTFAALQKRIKSLYEGASARSIYFRYALLTFDIVTVLFIVATSFLPSGQIIEALDVLFGAVILADFSARLLASRHRLRDFTRVSTWTDIIAIVSFLAPLAGESGAFFRILRTLRLLRNYQLLARLRRDSLLFRRNEEPIFAVTNLAVFIFVMTAIVYETQKHRNDQIANYADALYFTVTALKTTGFGDITLHGTVGRLISVVIMIFGVTLFFNLARAGRSLVNPEPCEARSPAVLGTLMLTS